MPRQENISIYVAKEFSDTPGPRYKKEGPKSGEQFYENLLLPGFKEALERRVKLFVDLDDTAGYATSFLEESFGNLSLEFGAKRVLETLIIKSDDEAYLKDEIERYINEAKRK